MSGNSRSILRTASMCSLPSPPSESRMQLDGDHTGSYRSNIATRPLKRSYADMGHLDTSDDDEVDQLASDSETSRTHTLVSHSTRRRTAPSAPTLLALGSPVNVSSSNSRSASRKQCLNPFLLADSSSSSQPPSAPPSSSSAEHALVSPTRPSRRRVDPDRIKLTASNITPPQKTRAQLHDERRAELEQEALEQKRREMGWDDPENPFLDRDDAMFKRAATKPEVKRPETLTYVKRGERIRTSIPFTAVLTSSCPSEDPFTYTTPRLLFPPAPPKVPTTPPSSFLEALRASSSTAAPPAESQAVEIKKDDRRNTTALPPTPVTLQRKISRTLPNLTNPAGGPSYKRMKLPNSEAEHLQHQRSGMRH
ncbi:uncharacterized protein JCM15063_004449 [Sporobolomyces koalae]|uniref:uncharacterized protein n=1 Tax=Sporobolomyces koalae TaxID=500713 RepID=UPI0031708D67